MKVIKQIEGQTSKGEKVTLEVGKDVEEVYNMFEGRAIVLYEGVQVLITEGKAVGLPTRDRPKRPKY